jgi:hypothetical protein
MKAHRIYVDNHHAYCYSVAGAETTRFCRALGSDGGSRSHVGSVSLRPRSTDREAVDIFCPYTE